MKTNLDKFFKTDENLEKNGLWMDLDSKTGFLVRHLGQNNPRVKAAFAQHYKPFARQIELGTLESEKNTEIQQKLFIDICLADWKGVEVDGKELTCTPENAAKLFKRLPALFETLWKYATDYTNYKEDVGNS